MNTNPQKRTGESEKARERENGSFASSTADRTTSLTCPLSHFPAFLLRIVGILALCAATLPAHATLSEPDNVLYGNISIDGVPVTAARTDVVIEARRTLNGPAIASYRIGTSSTLGGLYALRLQLESVAPLAGTNSSQVADTLFIVVTDGSGLRAQTNYTIIERGMAQRVDFGAVLADSDGDGLPDAWELNYFSGLGQNAGSLGLNGQTARQNFIAGTDPNDTNSVFRLTLTQNGADQWVSFFAATAQGAGYEGRQRYYAIEASTNPAGTWLAVVNASNVPGNNQQVSLLFPNAAAPAFFRGRVWLQP